METDFLPLPVSLIGTIETPICGIPGHQLGVGEVERRVGGRISGAFSE